MHCHTTLGHCAMQRVQCTASPLGGSGQWWSCNAVPHCLVAVGSANPVMHCHTAWGRRALELLQCASPAAGLTGSPTQEAVAA